MKTTILFGAVLLIHFIKLICSLYNGDNHKNEEPAGSDEIQKRPESRMHDAESRQQSWPL